MYQLQYEAISASNFKDDFELKHKILRRLNWQSTQYAQPPIEVLVRLVQRSFLLKIVLKTKMNKNIHALQVDIADSENINSSNAVFTTVSKRTHKIISVFNLTHNQCTINVSTTCRFVKLIITKKEQRGQASIDILRLIGDETIAQSYKMKTNLNRQRTDKLLIELGTRLESPELFDDLSVLAVDEETRITLRDMLAIESQYIRQSNFHKAQQINADLNKVLQLGQQILTAQQKTQWALTREDFKEAQSWDEEVKLLKRKRDKFDEYYETSRYFEMIELDSNSTRHDDRFAKLIDKDKKDYEAYKLREEADMEKKRALINEEYEKAKQQNEPWWEKNIETKQSIEEPQKPEEPQPAHVEQPPSLAESPRQSIKSTKSRQIKKRNPEQRKEEEGYDFSNPFVFNQGDADLQRFISPALNGAKLIPDEQILRHYEQLGYLDVLGSRAWLAITSQNWRQREAAAQSVLSFIQNGIPEKYRNGKSKQLFLALMEFAKICCQDKILQIYYDGLKIFGTSLAPPICGPDVSPAMINKVIKDFVPILITKIEEMNSRAKEISLETLISVFNHPAADIHILLKQLLSIFREDALGKNLPADKQTSRIVSARIEICLRMLQKIPMDNVKPSLKEIMQLVAIPSLFHPNGQVRMDAIELIGQLFRHLGQPVIMMVSNIRGLKSNLSEMINTKIDEVRAAMKK